jgi:hypothetical protein
MTQMFNKKIWDFNYHILKIYNSNCTLPFNICMLASVQVFTVGSYKFQSSGM